MQANRTEQALCGNSVTNYQLCTAPAAPLRASLHKSHIFRLPSAFALGWGEGGIGAGAAAAAAGGVTDGSCVGWMAVKTCRFVTGAASVPSVEVGSRPQLCHGQLHAALPRPCQQALAASMWCPIRFATSSSPGSSSSSIVKPYG